MAVKAIRISTGDDIVGDLSYNEEKDEYTIVNPVQLIMVPSKTAGQPSFGFAPFPVYGEQVRNFTLNISKRHVILECNIEEEFVNQYNSMFGAGIITPPKKLIV